MANAVAAPTCHSHLKPSPIAAACRYKNTIQDRYARALNACRPSVVACSPDVSYPNLAISARSPRFCEEHLCTGTPLCKISSTFSTFFGRDQDLAYQPYSGRQRYIAPVKAASSDAYSFRIPAIGVKPEWWWRTLACIPYLIALQISDVGFYLQPFSQHYQLFQNLIFYVPGAITRLPSWFTLMYCYIAYCFVVKNKDWPLFFRFHLMMGMLLETGLQICWHAVNFLPLLHYNGTFGMEFWAAMGFAYITVLLMCVRAAIAGGFIHIPIVSESAFIHSLFHIGGYHRPF